MLSCPTNREKSVPSSITGAGVGAGMSVVEGTGARRGRYRREVHRNVSWQRSRRRDPLPGGRCQCLRRLVRLTAETPRITKYCASSISFEFYIPTSLGPRAFEELISQGTRRRDSQKSWNSSKHGEVSTETSLLREPSPQLQIACSWE